MILEEEKMELLEISLLYNNKETKLKDVKHFLE